MLENVAFGDFVYIGNQHFWILIKLTAGLLALKSVVEKGNFWDFD